MAQPPGPDPKSEPGIASGMPSREAVRRFVRESRGKVGKREVAKQFGLGPEHRPALRDMLRALAAEGELAAAGDRRYRAPDRLPEVLPVQVTGTDPEGDPIARPLGWSGPGRPPLILMAPERRGQPALAPGDRVLARLKRIAPGKYEGRTQQRIGSEPARILGVYRAGAPGQPGRLVPTDRRAKAEWLIPSGERGGAEPGELVLASPLPHAGYGLKQAAVIERLGSADDPRAVSLVAIHAAGIPTAFPPDVLAEADAAGPAPLGTRTELRDLPLVTIDGEDARDFDDAVFAERRTDGFRIVVAIADVAHYVRPGSALDREARTRGNSAYFPDRVVPMLPEALSNGWCSLKPGEDRGCLYADLTIDGSGRATSHRFGRGLMRSAARLTYEQVQAARESGDGLGLPDGHLAALYDAFAALLAARVARGTLDLDLPERRVLLDAAGRVHSVTPRPRLDSHRLIEEFMVLANVAAARELGRAHRPCLYRVHAPPSDEKLLTLRTFLATLGLSLPPGREVHPRVLDGVLRQVAGTGQAQMVNEVMLRSQSQAAYASDNIGHFGLALPEYAHFTSPIRRYADLVVHRSLITALGLGGGGLRSDTTAGLEDLAEHITATERRAALAERDATDRYLALWMQDRVGAVFDARISGVTRFALFVTLSESGASGIVPLATLPDDQWVHDEAAQTMTGRRTRLSFRLTESVEVRLSEANAVTGGLVFNILQGAPHQDGPLRERHSRTGVTRRGTKPRRR